MRAGRGVLLAIAVLLAVGGCGASDGEPSGSGGDGGEIVDDGDLSGGDLGTAVPACPLTAADVSQLTGRTMLEDGTCNWRDDQGVAIVSITLASELAGRTTYAMQRDMAEQQYDQVTDSGAADSGYRAAGEINGEAVVISKEGTYTISVGSFGGGVAGVDNLLTKLVEALPAGS